MLTGLSHLFIELTSRCDKKTFCACCAHQSLKFNPTLQPGDMDFKLLEKIRSQLSPGIDISLHHDGDPLVYPRLSEALDLFDGFLISIVTHGQSLGRRAGDIIGKATTVTVSVVHPDPDWHLQIESVKEFLSQSGDSSPMVNLKFVGEIPQERVNAYGELRIPIIRRLLHVPDGNYRYVRRDPTIPESYVCLDMLHCPSIDWRGHAHICNRFNPSGHGLLGDLNESTLDELWNSPKRMAWLDAHKRGRRDQAAELCKTCLYYGVPTGG